MKIIILITAILLSSCIQYPEQNISTSSPTNLPSTGVTESSSDITCTKEWVTTYLTDVDTAMKNATTLANDFGQSESREKAMEIAKEVEDLSIEVAKWKVPDCAKEVQVNLILVIMNISIMQQDIFDNDIAAFNRDYKVYEISVSQLNAEARILSEANK